MVQHTKLSEAHLKLQEVVIGPLHYVQALYGPNDVSINRSLRKPADLLQHQSAKTGGFFQRSGFCFLLLNFVCAVAKQRIS